MVWKYLKKVEKKLFLILASSAAASSFAAVSMQLDSWTKDDTMIMMIMMNETKHVFCSFIGEQRVRRNQEI